jgi:hypothetical protein
MGVDGSDGAVNTCTLNKSGAVNYGSVNHYMVHENVIFQWIFEGELMSKVRLRYKTIVTYHIPYAVRSTYSRDTHPSYHVLHRWPTHSDEHELSPDGSF